ncbi:MAG: PAS domain-containing protein, partial [Pseudomonadota bacterium]|nr:PAS domain-containing protein [Pseudomonadota bacterium]
MTTKYDLFANGGQMGELARAHPWQRSALGSPADWPPLLQSTLRLVLTAQHPMLVWWGTQLIQFYNDACSHTLGPQRHPAALGQPGPACWPDIWHRIGPEIEHVLAGKGATWHVDEALPFAHGSLAEQRWTYGLNPLEDQDGIHGVLVMCNDVGAECRAHDALAAANQRLLAEVARREDLERQQAFQLRLLDALVGLGSADDIAAQAFAILGQELRASSVNYARIDADSGDFLITHAWHRVGLPSVIGEHGNLRMFGAAMCSALERGETFSATDVRRDPRTAECAPAYQRLTARAVLIVPIMKNGKLCAGLGINSSTPREWPARHLTLLVDVAERIWNAIERSELEAMRLQSQQALLAHQASETENLRRLFQQAPGFIAVLKGPQHIFEIANDAYRAAVGGRELIGRRIREALPELDGQGFFELLDHVYASGTPYLARGMEVRLRQTNREEPEQKFVDFVFQPIVDAQQAISGIFVEGSDISDKYRAEQRQRFRTALSDQLRQRDAIEPLIDAAAGLLGQHLEVARVVALEFVRDSGEAMCRAVWQHGGAPGPTRAALLSSITPQLRACLTAGQTVAIDDVHNDARLREQRALYATLNIGACLMVPVADTGALTLVLAVQQSAPQRWRADQIATVRDTVERTAVALSNLRARIELDRERHQSAYVFNTMAEGFAVVDRNWTILQMNSEGLRLTRREAASTIGRNHWTVFPELVGTDLQAAYEKVRETGAAQLVEIPYPDPAGAENWIEIRIYPALDDGLAFFFR